MQGLGQYRNAVAAGRFELAARAGIGSVPQRGKRQVISSTAARAGIGSVP
jgi:hypothetical protein